MLLEQWFGVDVTVLMTSSAFVLLSGFVSNDFIKKLSIKYGKSKIKCLNDVIIYQTGKSFKIWEL